MRSNIEYKVIQYFMTLKVLLFNNQLIFMSISDKLIQNYLYQK